MTSILSGMEASLRISGVLTVDGSCHPPVGVADAPDSDGIGLDVFRQGHTAVARVAQVVDIGAGHFAHQGDLPDGGHVRALLGGADGGDGEAAQTVGIIHQPPDIFQGNARDGAGSGQKNDIRAGFGEGGDILPGDDLFRTLGQDAGGSFSVQATRTEAKAINIYFQNILF